MTLDDLDFLLRTTRWFEHLGEPLADARFMQISSLAPWGSSAAADATLDEIADQMQWLPSSRDEDDPFHGRELEVQAERSGKKDELRLRSQEMYRRALASLQVFSGHPALKVGPHDFTEAARGAALFAVRRAASEIVVNNCGVWCTVMSIYNRAHWPCGILPNGTLVVL